LLSHLQFGVANDESIFDILLKDVKGLKYFKAAGYLLERLHEVGKDRDKANTAQWIASNPKAIRKLLSINQTIRVIVKGSKIDHPVRLVIVKATPHTRPGRRRSRNFLSIGAGSDESIRMITDMHLDLALHRSNPNQAYLRDDLLLHERTGKPC